MTPPSVSSNLSRCGLRVSPSGRHVMHADGTAFFYLGDTAWELFHRLDREDATLYLRNRAEKGFTVVQAVVLAELDGLRVPNAYGEIPLENLDPTQLREGYFRHVDWGIDQAASLGLYVGLLPTWGDKVNQRYEWAKGPEIFTPENAGKYGKLLGNRYREKKNIIWILGGDRDPDERAIRIWRAMAAGIREGVGGNDQPLMTFHPQPFGTGSSSRWFHHDDWLDFHMLQTGHDQQKNTFDQVAADYALQPAKPVMDGEPTYEAHGLSFKPFENGYSSDAEVRKYAYWALFSGAFGHTYGCHSVWQFYTPEREGINFPIYPWKDALDLAGATQMTFMKKLMTSRPMLHRIPDQSLIRNNQPKGGNYLVATRAEDGHFAFVYSPTGKPFQLRTAPFPGRKLSCSWFNPRDGVSTVQQVVDKKPTLPFQPPNRGYGNDWVLVVDSQI